MKLVLCYGAGKAFLEVRGRERRGVVRGPRTGRRAGRHSNESRGGNGVERSIKKAAS